MYWFYLIIFILAVLVPDIVPHGSKLFFLGEEQLEEFVIFVLGLTGFLIFRWKEKQSNVHLKEKIEIQKEAHQISRNLTDTYSYIGESNRKLDIMKNISSKISEIYRASPGKEKQFFDTLLESIYILGKSRRFSVRFINLKSGKTEKELKSKKKLSLKADNDEIIKNFSKKEKNFTEDNYHFIITSPEEIDETISAIIISKNNQQQKLEDPDIMKVLASQSLFIYEYLKKQAKE